LELPVIYPRGGPHGEHRILLSLIVLGVFTDPLLCNRRRIVARVGSRGNMFTESLTSNGSIRQYVQVNYEMDFTCLLRNTTSF
jgi:hypothetical protein